MSKKHGSGAAKREAKGLWLHGASGRMGLEIQKAVAAGKSEFRLAGGSGRTFEGGAFYQGRPVTPELLGHMLAKDDVAVIVDFSTPEANQTLFEATRDAALADKSILIGTTGLDQELLAAWRKVAKKQNLRLLVAPNTSIGILLAVRAALLVTLPLVKLGFDIEIVETHHRRKIDAPSGTARFLAETLADENKLKVVTERSGSRAEGELGVHAIRGGGIYGEHMIRILGEEEELCIEHRALSRGLFAAGALVLGAWLCRQNPGAYELLDIKAEDLVLA